MRRLQTQIASALLSIAMLIGLAGCNENSVGAETQTSSSTSVAASESAQEAADGNIIPTEDEDAEKQAQSESEISPGIADTGVESASITLDDIPAYSGQPYVVINNNIPFFTDADMTTESFENYSALDMLGRCGVAYSCVGQETMPTEKRGSIGMVKPSGWHTVKYNFVDGKYLYNRCHLIGYQLTAENANERNLITGTRSFNVVGMLPFENMTADYIKETNNHVLYRVTPMYRDTDLVATGVLMEAKSVEDNGDGVLFCVFCYNVEPGVTIDYATGDSYENGEVKAEATPTPTPTVAPTPTPTPEPIATPTPVPAADPADPEPQGTTYILNTNTKKFHYPSCGSVKQMKDSNKQEYTGTRDEVIAKGYVPCKKCNP